jgi:hypothetical protein
MPIFDLFARMRPDARARLTNRVNHLWFSVGVPPSGVRGLVYRLQAVCSLI